MIELIRGIGKQLPRTILRTAYFMMMMINFQLFKFLFNVHYYISILLELKMKLMKIMSMIIQKKMKILQRKKRIKRTKRKRKSMKMKIWKKLLKT